VCVCKQENDVAFNLVLTLLTRLNRLSLAIDVYAGLGTSAQVKDVYFALVCPAISSKIQQENNENKDSLASYAETTP
jgi:hypothetical protein